MPKYRTLTSRSTAAAAMGALVLTSAAACVDGGEDQQVYCVDRETNQTVPCDIEDRDSSGSTFFYWYGGSGHGYGHTVPSDQRGSYFHRNDTAARTKYGLPASGKVGGTKFSSSSGKSSSGGGSSKSGSKGG